VSQCIPKFLVIGSQKAGTSSLFFGLNKHPQIYMPPVKEVKYFFQDESFALGPAHYESFFKDAPQDAVCGEASPGYICHPRSPQRIFRQLPDVKLILTIRDPVERAYSQYWDNRRQLQEGRAFDTLLEGPLHQVFTPERRNYFSRGLYSVYLQRYLDLFPRSQILIIQFDALKREPDAVFKRCFEFIGVDPDFESAEQREIANFRSIFANPLYRFFFDRPALAQRLPSLCRRMLRWGSQVPYTPEPISEQTESLLREFYQPYDRALSELLGERPYWVQREPELTQDVAAEQGVASALMESFPEP